MVLTTIQLISKLSNFLNIWNGLLIPTLILIFHLLSKMDLSLLNLYYPHIPNILLSKNKLDIIIFYFLTNFTSFDNSCLLDWKHISSRLNKIPKGKIPLWFTFF